MTEKHTPPENGSQSIMAMLASQTRQRHEQLSSLPFFKALIDHKLPLDSYVNQLRVLAVIHSVLEQEVESTNNKFVRQVWSEDMRKFALLQADLKFFEPRTVRDSNAALDEAYEFTRMIRKTRIDNPKLLLSIVYVFEGTTLGNDMHHQDVIDTFKLMNGTGSGYYRSYGDDVHNHWEVLKVNMNHTFTTAQDKSEIIAQVFEVFDRLEKIYKRLFPLDTKGLTSHVARINPLAGNHPIPDDDREIEAALKTSNILWREFPYYEHRFGERGKMFSDSDICWLATLAKLSRENFESQITWFSTVLASRGMPTILLEKTLIHLGEELIAAVPDKKYDYQKLILKGKAMEQERRKKIGDEQLSAVVGDFNRKIGTDLATKHPDVAILLAGAAYDVSCGIPEALPSLLAWVHDGNVFPDKWIIASEDLLDQVKAILSIATK